MHRSSSSFWPFKRPKRRHLTSLYIYKKRRPGLSRVYPGRSGSGSTGFYRANSQTGFCLDQDRSQARVDPPGRSGFQNTAYKLCSASRGGRVLIIVLDSVWWSGFEFWLGYPGQFFFNQNEIVLVKNKKTKANGLQPGFWPAQSGHTGFFLSLFFLQPGPVQSRVSRVSKL